MKTIYTADQLKSVYGEPKNLQVQSAEQKGENIFKSIAKDVTGTLVVNPITRATEAVTRTLAPESQAAKGFEMLQEEGKGQDVLGVNVPSVTGGKQIIGEALKTASYLFPYGKVAGLAGKTLGKIGGNVASGATGGYLADVGYGLTDKEQTVGEALTPGAGTTIGGAIPLASPALRGTGRAVSKLGSKAVEVVIPVSKREAGILQTYKANNPFFKRVADVLQGTEKAPTTAGKTATTTTAGQTLPGLFGTKSQIGVQAKRAKDSLWKDVIQPRLRASEQAVDLDGFFAKVEDDIIKSNPELSRQKSLLEALNAVRDDYAGTKVVSLEGLQKLKEGWAKFVPDKAYQGKPIGGAFNDVRNQLADEARQTIYTQLGDDVKQAYFDYGNLKGLAEMGKVSMTGQKLKGGTGGLLSEILSQTITPIGTVGGQAVYRLGKGIEFVGNLGAKNLGEALGVNLKFPGDMAVDDISKTVKKAKSLPNKQGGFIKLDYDSLLNDKIKLKNKIQKLGEVTDTDLLTSTSKGKEFRRLKTELNFTEDALGSLKNQDASLPTTTQSSQTASKVKNTVIPKSSPKSPTKSIDPLISEAKKYKSAEEFVKAQTKKDYVSEVKPTILKADDRSVFKTPGEARGNAREITNKEIEIAGRDQKIFDVNKDKTIAQLQTEISESKKWADENNASYPRSIQVKEEIIKTKSQLIDIWKKGKTIRNNTKIATDKLNEVLTKETIPPEALEVYRNSKWQSLKSKSIDPLISEAKKYKSAEEFVRAQRTFNPKNIEYHGTGKSFDRFMLGEEGSSGAGTENLGVFTTKSKEAAKFWAEKSAGIGKNGKVMEVYLDVKNPKIFKSQQALDDFLGDNPEQAISALKKQGFDAIKYPESGIDKFPFDYWDELESKGVRFKNQLPDEPYMTTQVFDPKKVHIIGKEGIAGIKNKLANPLGEYQVLSNSKVSDIQKINRLDDYSLTSKEWRLKVHIENYANKNDLKFNDAKQEIIDILKTKSQLIDIWKKANSKANKK